MQHKGVYLAEEREKAKFQRRYKIQLEDHVVGCFVHLKL